MTQDPKTELLGLFIHVENQIAALKVRLASSTITQGTPTYDALNHMNRIEVLAREAFVELKTGNSKAGV